MSTVSRSATSWGWGSSTPTSPRTRTTELADVVANVRTLAAPGTGIQRYTREVVARLGDGVDRVAPARWARGVRGHLWEQTVLPRRVGDRLLWSPGGTGPWSVERQVVTIHDAAALDHPEWFGRRFAHWYRFLLPRLLGRVRRVITVSEFSRARLVAHVPGAADRIVVTPLAAGEAFGAVPSDEVAKARADLRLPETFVLTVGTLQPRKNLGRLLAAWDVVRPRVPGARLVVAGTTLDSVFRAPGLRAAPRDVVFLGYVRDPQLPALYAAAHAFVYPSLYEGFGLPPLEALASGTPTLVANAGSLPEVVGPAAIRVDPCDVAAIAAGIERIVVDEALRARLRDAGRVRAADFSWDATAAATERVLAGAV